MMPTEKNLKQIKTELNFIRRAVEEIKFGAKPEGEDEFTVPAPREQGTAPLIAGSIDRNVFRARSPVI